MKSGKNMGRLGQLPLKIPASVNITIDKGKVVVKGPKGELKYDAPDLVGVELKDGELTVSRKNDSTRAKEAQGSTRSHISNIVGGVYEGWRKQLEIVGPGFRAEVKGNDLVILAGFSHPVIISAPEGIAFKVEKNVITVEGTNKETVGQTSAVIRAPRRPNPYTGAGIKYSDEVIRRKAGKQAAKAGE